MATTTPRMKITYATLSADNEELQSAFDAAVERVRGELLQGADEVLRDHRPDRPRLTPYGHPERIRANPRADHAEPSRHRRRLT